MKPTDALEKLKAGNSRYVAGTVGDKKASDKKARNKKADFRNLSLDVNTQQPFAVVLGCSDSRVPPEVIFDQGLGDLFVVRVAGNVVTDEGIGSIEFAASKFGTRLVLVLGHSHCGAVSVCLDQVRQGGQQGVEGVKDADGMSANLAAIISKISPAAEAAHQAQAKEGKEGKDDILAAAIRANVEAGVRDLQARSPLLADLVQSGEARILGAEYALATGEVAFYDEKL